MAINVLHEYDYLINDSKKGGQETKDEMHKIMRRIRNDAHSMMLESMRYEIIHNMNDTLSTDLFNLVMAISHDLGDIE